MRGRFQVAPWYAPTPAGWRVADGLATAEALRDPSLRPDLRRFYADGGVAPSWLDERQLARWARDALASGRLVLLQRVPPKPLLGVTGGPRGFVDPFDDLTMAAADVVMQSSVPPPTPDPAPTPDWIEVELADRDGNPIVGETVRFVLADGRVRSARSDENGVVRLLGIDPGSCQVSLPSVDLSSLAPPTAA